MLKTDQNTTIFMFKLRINWYEMIAEKELWPPGTLQPFKKQLCDVTRIVAIAYRPMRPVVKCKTSTMPTTLNVHTTAVRSSAAPRKMYTLTYGIYAVDELTSKRPISGKDKTRILILHITRVFLVYILTIKNIQHSANVC